MHSVISAGERRSRVRSGRASISPPRLVIIRSEIQQFPRPCNACIILEDTGRVSVSRLFSHLFPAIKRFERGRPPRVRVADARLTSSSLLIRVTRREGRSGCRLQGDFLFETSCCKVFCKIRTIYLFIYFLTFTRVLSPGNCQI